MFHSLLSSTTGVTCSDKSHRVLLAMISYWFVVLFVFFYYCMIVAKTIKSVYTFTEVDLSYSFKFCSLVYVCRV